jgi:hypothetical protein
VKSIEFPIFDLEQSFSPKLAYSVAAFECVGQDLRQDAAKRPDITRAANGALFEIFFKILTFWRQIISNDQFKWRLRFLGVTFQPRQAKVGEQKLFVVNEYVGRFEIMMTADQFQVIGGKCMHGTEGGAQATKSYR